MEAVVVGTYLVVTLIVGYYSGRGVSTMRDFAVSNRRFTTVTMVATIFATWVGGGKLFSTAEKVYKVGLIYFVTLLSETLCIIFMALLVKRLYKFKDTLSFGDVMDSLYGKCGRVISGLCVVCKSTGLVGVQVAVMAHMCRVFMGVDIVTGIIIGSVPVILYACFGGIRAVAFTDVLQFGIIVVVIPILVSIALNKAGGFENIIESVPASHLCLINPNVNWTDYLLLFVIWMVPSYSAQYVQRVVMAKNEEQARNSLFCVAGLHVGFMALLAIMGLCAIVILPNSDPRSIFPELVNTVFPPGMKAVAIVFILAAAMSTSDSGLNTASISAVRDVIGPFSSNKMSDRKELFLARVTTILIGLVSMFVVTKFKSVFDIWVYFGNFWRPFIVPPFLCGLFNFKVSPRSFLYGVSASAIFMAYWMIFVNDTSLVGGIIPGALINFGVLFFHDKYERYKTKERLGKC